jgi:glycosyltransferase involved in cell wall biosynthesis
VNVLQLVSCRGWSSDAYWAARITRELERRGHRVTLGCRAGTEATVIERARGEGVRRVDTFAFVGGVRPRHDVGDIRRLTRAVADADLVHVHRGKEHWLAAVANRLGKRRRPLVRTRHIVQAVRAHAGNRWLYGQATDLVVTVSEAIRRQYVASGLLPDSKVIALPGGADAEAFRPSPAAGGMRRALGAPDGETLIGMVGGLRVMKGHAVAVEALRLLRARRVRAHLAVVGQGRHEAAIRQSIADVHMGDHVTLTGFTASASAVMSALDVGLYVPLESDGMSRVVFEYLAVGCPLIAARTGVVPEILRDGEHARLVPAGDAVALAHVLAEVIGDSALRRRLSANGRALIEAHCSGARLAERLEALYAALLPGPCSASRS